MLNHPFDILALENGANIIFTPCPGTKETSLVAAVTTLKEAGTSMLITLMFDQEMESNNAMALPNECQKQGIQWVQLPIADDAAPEKIFETQWMTDKAAILKVISEQGTVAVHCKGGSGRTGLVIAIILLALGWSIDKTIETVQEIRPKALKNPTQLAYLKSFI